MFERLSEHFTAAEFTCRCQNPKCPAQKRPHPALVERLEELRTLWGRPIWIISGIRCVDYNKTVGGAPASQHLLGKAADIKTENENEVRALAALAERVGFKGIGTGKRKLHVDVRAGRRARWTYEE